MTTWTDFDPTVPDSSQAGPDVTLSANANDVALWAMLVMSGMAKGWTLAVNAGSGTAEQPQWMVWSYSDSLHRVRATNTWGTTGGELGNITQSVIQYTTDGASTPDSTGTWASVCTIGYTLDSSGNVTATTGGGGFMSFVTGLFGKVKAAATSLGAHIAAEGTAVHGLGTMSTQGSNAVAITGGDIDGVPVGVTTPAEGRFNRATEEFASYSPGAGAGVTVDWSKGGSFISNSGTNALTFSNVPSTRLATHVVICSNFNNTTFPAAVTWGVGGKPSIAGGTIAQLLTLDGGATVYGLVAWRAV